jgi:hypothetical protein
MLLVAGNLLIGMDSICWHTFYISVWIDMRLIYPGQVQGQKPGANSPPPFPDKMMGEFLSN